MGWLPFLCIISLRLLWQWKPVLWACIAFWGFYAGYAAHNIASGTTEIWYVLGVTGGAMNAAVTLANGGVMPTVGFGDHFYGSIWRPHSRLRNPKLLLLADRFWLGTSIGDWFIISSLILSIGLERVL